MRSEDKKRFSMAMGMLAVAFDLDLTQQRMAIYFEAMADEPIWAVEWAAKEAVKRCGFFPRAKELRDLCGIAPRPEGLRLDGPDPRPMLEELEPPEVARERLERVAEQLNRNYGTSFRVSEFRGRPSLVPCGRG